MGSTGPLLPISPPSQSTGGQRADLIAGAGIILAVAVVCWPLLAHLDGLPPDDGDLDLDLMSYYGYAAAARTTGLRFGQFPWRSPWHGGGYPLYAYPDDLTLTPTMLLVLAVGPWAAIKIDFVLTMMAAGVGMLLLTRRRMGYSLAGAVLSATAFALGGFLMARWMRGWRVPTHAVWLPLILYALWRGRQRRKWLAVAAGLVAWLIVDHKYVALVMGWFLAMVGLVRLDEEEPAGVGPAWGYFGRLAGVWAFGAGVAAVKLVPMAPLLWEHLRVAGAAPRGGEVMRSLALWGTIFVALGATPLLGRLMRVRRTRPWGLCGMAAALAAVVLAAALWAPPRRPDAPAPGKWLREVVDSAVSFGTWRDDGRGGLTPTASDRYTQRAPVGPLICALAVLAVVLCPRRTWKWAVLAGLFLAFELGPATPRELGESVRRLPLLSWVRRPREQLNFYLFFLLTLLAGRALDWRPALRRAAALRILGFVVAWGVVAANAVWTGYETRRRLTYTVSAELPPAPAWGGYGLLDHRDARGRPIDRWRDQPCLLLRQNMGLQFWDCDFRDSRREALVPSLVAAPDGTYQKNPENRLFDGMARMDPPENEVRGLSLTPNEIVVHVMVRRPGTLTINQLGDDDWRVSEGTLVPDEPLLKVRLSRIGSYTVRLRYVPTLFWSGLVLSAASGVGGILILLRLSRRRGAATPPGQPRG